ADAARPAAGSARLAPTPDLVALAEARSRLRTDLDGLDDLARRLAAGSPAAAAVREELAAQAHVLASTAASHGFGEPARVAATVEAWARRDGAGLLELADHLCALEVSLRAERRVPEAAGRTPRLLLVADDAAQEAEA